MSGKVKLNDTVLTRDYMILEQLSSKFRQSEVLDIVYKSYKNWVKENNMKAIRKMEELEFFNYYSNSMLLKGVENDEIKQLIKEYM